MVEPWVPILLFSNVSFLSYQQVSGQDLVDSFESSLWRRNVAERKVLRQSGPVQPTRNFRRLENRFRLGTKDQAMRTSPDVEWFLADAVAREYKPITLGIPKSNAEHTSQALQKTQPFLLVQVNQDFRIALCAENVALGNQAGPQLLKVVNLSVANNPNCFIFVGDGLMPTREINDAQSSHSQGHAATKVHTLVVRAAMFDRFAHASQQCCARRGVLF